MNIPLPFGVRRGVTQAALLAAVLAVVVVGAVLVGTCALLLTAGQETALDVALQRADPQDVAVEATFRVKGVEPSGLVDDATGVLTEVLEPVDPVVSTWLTSNVRPLILDAATGAYGYVVSSDDLAEHAELVTGRWPETTSDPLEVAVPVAAASQLDLELGSELVLDELRDGTVREPVPGSAAVTLVVVGTFTTTPDESGTWDRDLLSGAGFDPTWELPTMMEQPPVTTYGPFVAAPEALIESAVEVDRVSLVARPDLAGLSADERDAVRSGVGGLAADLRTALGGDSQVRVQTDLRRTITAAEIQERVSGSAVLVVALLGSALAAAALALAGRLVIVRRGAELRLLAARGADRGQLVRLAAAESIVLALAAAGIAIPLASALYRWLTRLPPMADAGLTSNVGLTPALVITVVAGALILASVLVAPSVRSPDHQPRMRRSMRGRVARTSVDLLLVALAVVGYLQLRGRPFGEGGGADPVLVAAPVLCLVAGAAVALRVVPWVSRWAEGRARRSRRLIGPLASWEIARRGHSTGAALLLVLAAAGATFGTSLGATWSQSAQDQADAQVGTDISVGLTAADPLGQARALTALTGADVVPLTDREVSLGPIGDEDTAVPETRLVALDTTRDEELLRGRLPAGTTWSDLTSGLAPAEPVSGITLPNDADGIQLTISGTVGGFDVTMPELTITPTVVVETAGGGRQALEGWTVPLDGMPHELAIQLPTAGDGEGAGQVQVVAIDVRIGLGAYDFLSLPRDSRPLEITATVAASGSDEPTVASDGGWSGVVAADSNDRLRTPSAVTVSQDGADVTVTAGAGLLTAALLAGDADLVITGFAVTSELPVLISDALATAIAAEPGDALSLDIGPTTLVARVAGIVPAEASIPRGADILADHDAVSRAALVRGSYASVADAWWLAGVADPESAAQSIADAGLGDAVTREGLAEELRNDPLRIGVQLALWLLVAAAGVLAVAGTVVQTAAALEARAVDVARLQGMGIPRRSLVAALLVEHGVVSLLVVTAGGVVGAVAALTVGPLLVVSSSGQAPVPTALAVWSWPTQLALLAVLLVTCAVVVVPVAARLVRRATVTHLRMDGAG